jgi:PDZ domain-containing protein
VSRGRPNVWRFLAAKLDDDSKIIGEDSYLGGQSRARVNRQNVVAMDDSQIAAKAVALNELGYDVTATGAGAVVAQVVKGAPADGKLEIGDVITAVDGVPVTSFTDLILRLREHRPRETIEVEYLRNGVIDSAFPILTETPRPPAGSIWGVS